MEALARRCKAAHETEMNAVLVRHRATVKWVQAKHALVSGGRFAKHVLRPPPSDVKTTKTRHKPRVRVFAAALMVLNVVAMMVFDLMVLA